MVSQTLKPACSIISISRNRGPMNIIKSYFGGIPGRIRGSNIDFKRYVAHRVIFCREMSCTTYKNMAGVKAWISCSQQKLAIWFQFSLTASVEMLRLPPLFVAG